MKVTENHLCRGLEFWKTVLFAFGSDGHNYVWREPEKVLQKKNLHPMVKHGGGDVMVWGCMAASGVYIILSRAA
jgi:hypothetical protein